MSAIRVILDTNVFHGDAFNALEASPFRRLCETRRLSVIYGHVFFEECLRAYANDQRRAMLLDHWLPLIFQTASVICKDWRQTWREELVQGRGGKFWPFIHPKEFASIQRSAAHAPRDGSWHVYKKSERPLQIELQKRKDQKKLLVQHRHAVAAKGKRRKGGEAPFYQLLREFGPGLIAKHVRCKNPQAIAKRWLRTPDEYPFFSQFVINLIYLANFVATENNLAIDLNAQADLDVLTHLLHADLVVSNETGFLKTAFDQLWKPRGKVLMTSDEFIAHLGRL